MSEDHNRAGDNKKTTVVAARVDHEVRKSLETEAEDLGVTLGELTSRVLSKHTGHPMPQGKRTRGRPRKAA